MKAVVMAGGEGSRLRPLTINRPKPLVPIGNRPVMEHILRLLAKHEIRDIIATLHYLADEIQGYFDDGSSLGINLSYSIENIPLGTAGSVKKAEQFIGNDRFIIISGDALTDCNLTKAIEFHESKKSLATIILCRVPTPLEFGVVVTDEKHQITRFLEKPSWSEVFSDTVNTGIYILEPEILKMMEPDKPYDWGQEIFPRMLREGLPLYGYIMDDYWCDVGSLHQYQEATSMLLSGKVHLPMQGSEVQPGVWAGPNTTIDDKALIIPPVCIGSSCKIKKNAVIGPYTVIGDHTLVEEEAKIERSTIWESAYIGNNASIHSATLCSRVTIKKDVCVGEEAVIGDRCLLDVGSSIRPRVKLWPDKIIERGATVTMSLIWGNRWRGSLFRQLGIAGLSNIEITPEFATRLGSAFGSILPEGSKVATCRDNTRSSRMIKRAIIASLLSVGCDVLDMHNVAPAVARHYIRSSDVAGAVNVRKLPDNNRVTLVELLDVNGIYISKNLERKVESAFYREDFHRIDPDELGTIEFTDRANEEYQSDFFKHIKPFSGNTRLRIICDYGYSTVSSIFPIILSTLGIESISLNSLNDAKLAPRSPAEIQFHLENLSQIVSSLNYDVGILFTEEGERMTLVDQKGRVLKEDKLLATMCLLTAKTTPEAYITLPVTAPELLEHLLNQEKACVIRTKTDPRSIMQGALNHKVSLAGDNHGGFITPVLHCGYDAMSAFSRLISMLDATQTSLSDWIDKIPDFHMACEQVSCPWELKGTVMRKLAEDNQVESKTELLDGIKVYRDNAWILTLPDELEPVFHIYTESEDSQKSRDLITQSVKKIQKIMEEAS